MAYLYGHSSYALRAEALTLIILESLMGNLHVVGPATPLGMTGPKGCRRLRLSAVHLNEISLSEVDRPIDSIEAAAEVR
ncbi:hypothetical protein D3C87_1158960 [compost metagenome]